MPPDIGVALDDHEIEQFLKERGLGVLGLASGGEAYTIPIAFAYDEAANRCIFRFIMSEDSDKRTFISETAVGSLTAYEWSRPDDWKSVVARGQLQPIADEDLAHAAALFSDVGEETALEVFHDPISEYDTVWCELEISEVTGRGQFPGATGRTT